MRYAILSDIHSNLEALTAVLDALTGECVDRVVCLGDLVGYGADPTACLDRLEAAGAISVCGNHDWACIGKCELGWFNDAARAAVLWTRDQLGFAHLDWLRRLPLVAIEETLTLVHGTLTHPERFEYLIDLAQALDTAKACRTLYCLVGHTHIPCVLEADRPRGQLTRIVTESDELSDVALESDETRFRSIINPGSVGQPRDGDPRASFAILDTKTARVSIRRVAYNISVAQEKIRQAGLPRFLADRLAIGR